MTGLNVGVLLISSVLFVATRGEKCHELTEGPDVDMKRIFDNAPWYMPFQVNETLMVRQRTSLHMDCLVLTGHTEMVDRNICHLVVYNNGSKTNLDFILEHPINGVYKIAKHSEVETLDDQLKLEGSEERIHKEDITTAGKGTILTTDYKNYFILATCSSEGNWIIWLYMSAPNPTADHVNAARNKLANLGICSDQILPTKCGELAASGLLD